MNESDSTPRALARAEGVVYLIIIVMGSFRLALKAHANGFGIALFLFDPAFLLRGYQVARSGKRLNVEKWNERYPRTS